MCTAIPKDDPILFLTWLYHRLKNKFNEESFVLSYLSHIIHNYNIVETKFDIDFAEKLCAKHFIQYNIGSDNEAFYGFDEKFKKQLTDLVIDTVKQTGAKIASENKNIDLDISLE